MLMQILDIALDLKIGDSGLLLNLRVSDEAAAPLKMISISKNIMAPQKVSPLGATETNEAKKKVTEKRTHKYLHVLIKIIFFPL